MTGPGVLRAASNADLKRFRGIPFLPDRPHNPSREVLSYLFPIQTPSLLNSKASLLRVTYGQLKTALPTVFSSTHHHAVFYVAMHENFPLQCVKLYLKQSAMLQAWLEAILSQSISGRQEKADRVAANRNILSLRFFLPGYFCVISPVVIPA